MSDFFTYILGFAAVYLLVGFVKYGYYKWRYPRGLDFSRKDFNQTRKEDE